jgi:hypothetical protein
MSSAAFSGLAGELEAAFGQASRGGLGDEAFAGLALRCFALQFEENVPYRALCEARGVAPDTLARWEDVPTVPATAFKHLDLVTGPAEGVEAVFRTSGTSRGRSKRGRHLVPRLGLYRAAALPNFAAHLLPRGERLPLVSLIPSPEEAPESSLSAMMGMVAEVLCPRVSWVVDATGRLELDSVREEAASGEPLLVAGTALAFLHLLDALGGGEPLGLPPGTRIMETGGFKGRKTAVSRDGLYAGLTERLGVPRDRIVNEYGMTELLSQLYEPVLRDDGVHARRHVPPPWLRVRALDPVTLAPLPPGRDGLLAFFDLANLGSVCHVLTEDVGSVTDEGVHLRGRVAGAEPRGCSRAMDELMSAAGGVE